MKKTKFIYENDSLILKLFEETFHKSVLDNLEEYYFPKFSHHKKWNCYSDYSFDSKKANDVITFTFLPYLADPLVISEIISKLAPSEIKKTRSVNPKFLEFIKNSPFVTFSIIIEDHKNYYFENRDKLKEAMLLSLNSLLNESFPKWTKSRPHLKDYHRRLTKKTKAVIRLIERDKKIRIIKNLFLITSFGSYIATQFANKTKAEIFGWFSDRDEINDVEKNYSLDLFNIQFSEHLINENCKFVASPASSSDNEWYGEFIKIPDLITGAIADYDFMNDKVSHDKFIPIIRDLISDNKRNIFVFRLFLDNNGQINLGRLTTHKKVND
ncbi:MAG: hypothetical protein AAF611_04405 [Bacteroidota bacterium]